MVQSMGFQRAGHDLATEQQQHIIELTYPLKKGMATHSSILAWRIPWTEEPGGLQSIGSQRVRHDWSDWAQHKEQRWDRVREKGNKQPQDPCMHKHLTATVRGRDYYAVSFHEERGRKWQPTPVVLPGTSHGQRILVGYSPCGHKSAGHDLATEHG